MASGITLALEIRPSRAVRTRFRVRSESVWNISDWADWGLQLRVFAGRTKSLTEGFASCDAARTQRSRVHQHGRDEVVVTASSIAEGEVSPPLGQLQEEREW
jgi:hypothetical protein